MRLENWILTEEICTHYHVEETFIRALHESRIIHLRTVQQKHYLAIEEISEFEKMWRLHYEMDINMEGLESIQTLLKKIEKLQQEKQRLENRLRLFE